MNKFYNSNILFKNNLVLRSYNFLWLSFHYLWWNNILEYIISLPRIREAISPKHPSFPNQSYNNSNILQLKKLL